MTAQETAESFIEQAMMQGYNRQQAIEISSFAVDKIINYTNISTQEHYKWMDVLELLEFMV